MSKACREADRNYSEVMPHLLVTKHIVHHSTTLSSAGFNWTWWLQTLRIVDILYYACWVCVQYTMPTTSIMWGSFSCGLLCLKYMYTSQVAGWHFEGSVHHYAIAAYQHDHRGIANFRWSLIMIPVTSLSVLCLWKWPLPVSQLTLPECDPQPSVPPPLQAHPPTQHWCTASGHKALHRWT